MSYLRDEINPILMDIKNGDKSKRQVLFECTFGHLKQIALKYAYNKNEWEDILMEAYIRAFSYIENFDETKDGYNWLCKIVEHVAIDFNKKIMVTESLDSAVFETVFHIDPNLDSKNALIEEVNKLPDKDRKILFMRFWEDKVLKDIADELGTCKSNIHKRLNKLIAHLRKNLEKQ